MEFDGRPFLGVLQLAYPGLQERDVLLEQLGPSQARCCGVFAVFISSFGPTLAADGLITVTSLTLGINMSEKWRRCVSNGGR